MLLATGMHLHWQVPNSTADTCNAISGENSALMEDQWVTHPPERTGATTRTKGGSKGKLSCKLIKQKQLSKAIQVEPNQPLKTTANTHFIGEVEQNVVHPLLFF